MPYERPVKSKQRRANGWAGLKRLVLGILVLAGWGLTVSCGWDAASGQTLDAAKAETLVVRETERQGEPLVPICKIQGKGFSSPYTGRRVRTRGVVYADWDQAAAKGFFLQASDCDRHSASSDGLFVFLGAQDQVVNAGDLVEAQGLVEEFFGLTELRAASQDVVVLSGGHALPEPVDLNPPFDPAEARRYFEALEGMRVALDTARVVGPTSRRSEAWVVRADLGLWRVFPDDPPGAGAIITLGAGGPHNVPPVRVGEGLRQVRGALGYAHGVYQVLLAAAPDVDGSLAVRAQGGAKRAPKSAEAAGINAVTLATFNLENLFDLRDDPGREDPVPGPAAYSRQLAKLAQALHGPLGEPALVAVQEVENDRVLSDLVGRPEVRTPYQVVWVEGPDVRGIDVALLYDPLRVVLRGYQTHQACTRLQDGLGPDGNRDMQNPLNAATCDTDGDGFNDGNRLFSRPPLAVRVQVCAQSCGPFAAGAPLDLWLVVNHWKSKSQDTPWNEHTLARRSEQALVVAQLTSHLRALEPSTAVVVLGDLNDLPGSAPLEALTQAGLVNLLGGLPRSSRYTFI